MATVKSFKADISIFSLLSFAQLIKPYYLINTHPWIGGGGVLVKCLTCYTLLVDLLHIWFPSSTLCCQTMLMIDLIYALTSVCIFSILFFIHFLKCWQGEFVLGLKNFFSWWSFHLFSWPWYVIQGWYCKEKLNARHSKGSEVYVCSHSAARLPISLPPSVPFKPLHPPPPPPLEKIWACCVPPLILII